MYGAVTGRVRELATLQTIGFVRRAIALSLIQEGVLLAAAGSLIAGMLAVLLVQEVAVRFTMGAFALNVDSVTLLFGFGTGVLIGILGSIPPAIRAHSFYCGGRPEGHLILAKGVLHETCTWFYCMRIDRGRCHRGLYSESCRAGKGASH